MVKKRQNSTPNGENSRNVPYGCGLSDAPGDYNASDDAGASAGLVKICQTNSAHLEVCACMVSSYSF